MSEDEADHQEQQQEAGDEEPWHDANGTPIWSVGPQL